LILTAMRIDLAVGLITQHNLVFELLAQYGRLCVTRVPELGSRRKLNSCG
jgi:hypothetical protein